MKWVSIGVYIQQLLFNHSKIYGIQSLNIRSDKTLLSLIQFLIITQE